MLALCICMGAPAAQNLDDVVIPRKTEIFVRLERALHTKTARTGDRFHCSVDVPVTIDDRIVIPKGSYIIGHVDRSESAGRVQGKSQMRLLFDTVILPTGTTRSIQAVVQSAEEQKMNDALEDGTIEGGGSQGGETTGKAAGGAATGGVIGGLAGGWSGAGVGAAAGAATGALIGLLKKGKHVELRRGSSITIQLENAIEFVKPATKKAGSDG